MYSVLHISILYARYADPSGRTQDKETFDPRGSSSCTGFSSNAGLEVENVYNNWAPNKRIAHMGLTWPAPELMEFLEFPSLGHAIGV